MNTIFTTLRQCYGKNITVAGHSPVSIQFVTKDMFNSGKWERIGNEEILINNELLPHRESKAKSWVGAKVIGSGMMAKFLNAFYGLRAWDKMNDPEYYQKLLLPGSDRAVSA